MATAFLPFQLTSAQIRVQVAWGVDPRSNPSGWSWSDITADVMQDGGRTIAIQIGRQQESSTAPPAQCTLAVNNSTGNYTQFNPLSTNYPNVREGTPIEVQVFVAGTWYTRFFGFVLGFVPAWDTTGNYAITTINAYGVTRRLTQGTNPFRSALYRGVTLAAGTLLAYWPMEDGQYSNSFASAVHGQGPMTVSGAVQFAQDTGPPGSDQLPDFTGGGTATGVVTAAAPTAYRIEVAIQFPVIPTGDTVNAITFNFGAVTSSDLASLTITATPNAGGGIGFIANGGFGPVISQSNIGVENAWHAVRMDIYPDSGTPSQVDADLFLDDVQFGGLSFTTSTVRQLTSVVVNPTGKPDSNAPSVGHVTVWGDKTIDSYQWFRGNVGEDPAVRLARLCSEQGENFVSDVTGGTVVAMGPQGLNSFINLLRECELADAGYLYDGLDNGLDYIGVRALYNQTAVLTLDASAGQLQPPFSPESDDLGRVNDMTVSRSNGGTAVVTDTTSPLATTNVGVYDNSITINTQTDGPLADRASFEVARGTFDGFRYPTLSLDLRTLSQALILNWLAVTPGSALAMKLPYANQMPPSTIGLIVQGWTEQLSRLVWTVNPLNCTPQQPYQVAVYGATPGDAGSKFDAEDSVLSAGCTSTALSMSLASAANTVLWTTDVAEFPFDLNVGGEQCTVSGITGSSSPQTATISHRSVNGVVKAHSSGEPVTLWNTPRFAL